MKGLLACREGLCTSSKVLRFVDVNLRGIGQVMFQDNPLTGMLFFLAIGWGSYAGGVPQVAIGGLLGVVAATLMAQWLHVDEAGLASGLYGYNAHLVGLVLPTFLAVSPLLWVSSRWAAPYRIGREAPMRRALQPAIAGYLPDAIRSESARRHA